MTYEGPLRFASCMAPIANDFVHAVADFVATRLGFATCVVDDAPWQQREQWLDEGRVQVGWLCGLPYVWKADGNPKTNLELLAAPVMQDARYSGRPVYFSDVVVRRDGPFATFDALRGASWAYNERRSHSGYLITRYQLALRGLDGGFFGRVVDAGSHQQALALILAGEVDAAAIDSTVLALVQRAQPDVGERLRVLESWGPSPMPPWLVHGDVSTALRRRLQQILLSMHEEEEGRAALALGQVARFVKVHDRDYDPIRRMARRAEAIMLGEHV